jgi:hypothetical protein
MGRRDLARQYQLQSCIEGTGDPRLTWESRVFEDEYAPLSLCSSDQITRLY